MRVYIQIVYHNFVSSHFVLPLEYCVIINVEELFKKYLLQIIYL